MKMKILILLSFIYLFFTCLPQGGGDKKKLKPEKPIETGLNEDFLNWNENVFRNYFHSEESRKESMEALHRRCWDVDDAHSCYNLSILHYYFLKQAEPALPLIRKAISLKPDDELYRDLFQKLAVANHKEELIQEIYPRHKLSVYHYTKAIEYCRSGECKKAESHIQYLITEKILTEDILNSGVFETCFKSEELKHLKELKKNPVDYVRFLETEKNKTQTFYSIWDTLYYTRNQKLILQESLKSPLSVYWRDVQRGIKSNNYTMAKNSLDKFISHNRTQQRSDKRNYYLYLALEKAAIFLIREDPFFKNFRHLEKEF
ncbi:MAG: hypothetical protein H7A25_09755 [Leptospiraceae bacterium]|nr:hypothetical protein [Leptospiraceae bacterium]MCP5500174.1 hypothetical protein [Leptospiraceae bacterium]